MMDSADEENRPSQNGCETTHTDILPKLLNQALLTETSESVIHEQDLMQQAQDMRKYIYVEQMRQIQRQNTMMKIDIIAKREYQ